MLLVRRRVLLVCYRQATGIRPSLCQQLPESLVFSTRVGQGLSITRLKHETPRGDPEAEARPCPCQGWGEEAVDERRRNRRVPCRVAPRNPCTGGLRALVGASGGGRAAGRARGHRPWALPSAGELSCTAACVPP